jgi:adenosylcobalamin-dependent ribonucleoside-diphosphate reductase
VCSAIYFDSKVRKRDGRIEDFNQDKIANAINKAFLSLGKSTETVIRKLTDEVVASLNSSYSDKIPSVEDIQDTVEDVLIKGGYGDVAKAYILYRRERADVRESKKLVGVTDDLKLGLNAIKVLERRYLLKDSEGKPIETPSELFKRVAHSIAKIDRKYDPSADIKETERIFYTMMSNLEFLPNSPTLMNAGTDLGQLSACFVLPVEDNLPSIFDAVKATALIHQSAGGCISGSAYVYTDFCGVEKMATLYDRVRATGRIEEREYDFTKMDVRDLNIRTISFNPEDGAYEPARVTHLWRYHVPLADQVQILAANGLKIITSRWHPFFVFDGSRLVKRRADQLRVGDILPTPDDSIRRRWPHVEYKDAEGQRIDEEVAWLLGFYLGDGSLGLAKVPESKPRRTKLRWRLFDGRTASLEQARRILHRRFQVNISIQRDGRGVYSLATTSAGFIQQFCNILGINPGPKIELPFPEMIAKSPVTVVGAFLAGLIDSDGYVDNRRDCVTFTTQSGELARKVTIMCSLLGLSPSMRMRSRVPHGRGRSIVYEVKLAAEPKIDELRELIVPYLNDTLKVRRSRKARFLHVHSTSKRLPIPFSAVEDMLIEFGIETSTTRIHKQPVQIGESRIWLHRWKWELGISSSKLLKIVSLLRPLLPMHYQNRLNILERLGQSGTTVKTISSPTKSEEFYDFTVDGHNTYLAGTNGLTAVHNTGFSFSKLRPQGDRVKTTGGVASGPVSFMKIFDATTEEIKQGGKRRGANMGILSVYHPDIIEFIGAKSKPGFLRNFNISVAVDDKFMKAALDGKKIDLVNPRDGKITASVSASNIFEMIVSRAWETGDPGLIFIDAINRDNPTPKVGEIEATNPCAEEPLLPYESCNLGSINLTKFIDKGAIDWKGLMEIVRESVHFLDNVIDANRYPLKEIAKITLANRKIGLGIMGFAEALIMLNVKYDSEEALALAQKVMRFIQETSHEASVDLALKRGSFPNFKDSIWPKKGFKRIRNATVTTIAPTGTISIIAGCSSGIEPLFAVSFVRDVMEGTKLLEVNPLFEKMAREKGILSNELLVKIAETGSIQNLDVPQDLKKIFVTALDIDPEWHVRIQAAFQKHTDNAVSKTINLRHDATIEDVRKSYLLAWKLKCKGITVYRYGSKPEQVLYIGAMEKGAQDKHVVADSEYAGGCAGTTCPN